MADNRIQRKNFVRSAATAFAGVFALLCFRRAPEGERVTDGTRDEPAGPEVRRDPRAVARRSDQV